MADESRLLEAQNYVGLFSLDLFFTGNAVYSKADSAVPPEANHNKLILRRPFSQSKVAVKKTILSTLVQNDVYILQNGGEQKSNIKSKKLHTYALNRNGSFLKQITVLNIIRFFFNL